MRRLFAILFLTITSVARADLVLGTDAGLTMTQGTTSGEMLVTVTESGVASTPILGWRTSLLIEPDPGFVGTVIIASVSQPATNYLSGMGPFNSNGASQTYIQTWAEYNGGTVDVILPSTTRNLAGLILQALGNAFGTFGLYALDEPAGAHGPGDIAFRTNWTDHTLAAVQFANVPSNTAPIRIGTIMVVPEPSSFLYGLIPLSIASAWRIWIKRWPSSSRTGRFPPAAVLRS